ncbi:Rne/Rng family ribonuclease [Microlunatus speluncae]|uniref:Rne/Rng family ribonuclease n=1 Tax=Microlunatus speluncae TaxID=2594267 RepID=UPI00126640C0|nr:Rne/Rng family ribonuclease [Microlunatus speluncae]
MLDHEPDKDLPNEPTTLFESPVGDSPAEPVAKKPARRRRAATRPAGPPSTAPALDVTVPTDTTAETPAEPAAATPEPESAPAPAKRTAKKAASRRTTKKAAAAKAAPPEPAVAEAAAPEPVAPEPVAPEPVAPATVVAEPAVAEAEAAVAETPKKATRRRTKKAAAEPEAESRPARKRASKKAAAKVPAEPATVEEPAIEPVIAVPTADEPAADLLSAEDPTVEEPAPAPTAETDTDETAEPAPADQAQTDETAAAEGADPIAEAVAALLGQPEAETEDDETAEAATDDSDDAGDDVPDGHRRRRRRRGGRRRRRNGSGDGDDSDDEAEAGAAAATESTDQAEGSDSGDGEAADGESEGDGTRRRRRRRRRRGEDGDDSTSGSSSSSASRSRRDAKSEVTGIDGSTRMEAKRQRRREGREAGRRRAPILSEAEFLSRRESVTRKMVIRQRDDLTQIAVLEDDVLVEHYVDRESAASLIGNVYLGRVQNVLPSMEAAFIDIGRGRNAVLYAGEVDWESFHVSGEDRKVEKVLKSGQPILVQVSKDPVGAKGARLTNHVTIPGRYVVYAPGGHLSGISRKLPDTERKRLKDILGELVPDDASVVVRTAAEGASEDELVRDVNRLRAQWEDIEKKVKSGSAPQLLYGEPDLTVRIVRDLFTEDFAELIVQGNGSQADSYDVIQGYVGHVAPHLADRMKRYEGAEDGDLFAEYRLDEQIAKALERKVFLPSGGSLIIDRTEAMTVIDVNTGKFTGTGGNLEATVTSNNLEAAEEIVRQLRLRDIGGIIVIDFIDMVLPSNRELLLRRLVECLGRDRTRHQVAEVTSLGLVQLTRKRIGTGLLEAFSTPCPHCNGRGLELHDLPVETQSQPDGGAREHKSGGGGGRGRGGRSRSRGGNSGGNSDNNGNGNARQDSEAKAEQPA